MFEMLARLLAVVPIHALTLGQQKRRRFTERRILAIDVSMFRPLADFIGDADALAAIIKALPPQQGLDEILLPGERSARTEAVRRKCGIPIPAKLREELEEIAKARTISMPAISPSAAASPPKSSKPQPASAQSADRPAHGRQAIAPTGRCARCGRARARARSASATARCRRAALPE
jgi:Malate/L-lactate dehydrogenase